MITSMELANGSLEIFAALVIFILLISMCHNHSTDFLEHRLTIIVYCHMAVLLLDGARWLLPLHSSLNILHIFLSVSPTILAMIGNTLFVFFTIAFLSRHGPVSRKLYIPLISLFVFGILVWLFFILANGIHSAAIVQTNHDSMQHSWGYWVGHLGWASVCIIGLGLIWRCRKGLSSKELLSLSSYCIFPLIALILRFFWDGPQIFLSTSLSLIWIYAVIQREQRQRLQEQEAQLVQSRISILLSQIQPHFLYNTLTAICGLCDENPKEAKRITAEFADYLRHLLESLSNNTSIPFVEELQLIKVYLSIEKKRFEEKLNIVYHIQTEDFMIPALTVQPLVENAVKHGVLKIKKGGTVTIYTAENSECYEISIMDNGLGFDPAILQTDDNKHIGIQNVRDRLWAMCQGTLIVHSEPGKGTTAVIKIPKGDIEP